MFSLPRPPVGRRLPTWPIRGASIVSLHDHLDTLSDFTQKASFLFVNSLIPLALIAAGIMSGVFLLRIAFRKRDFHWKLDFPNIPAI